MVIKNKIALNTYTIISRAVEEGVAVGYRRAHKHTNEPDEESLKENLHREVMNSLCEVVSFDEESI